MNTLDERDASAVGVLSPVNLSRARRAPWRWPLYVQIVSSVVLGVVVGLWLPASMASALDVPARLILRLLGAVAPPLILLAVMRALLGASVHGKHVGRMFFLLALNTLVAIMIGLATANAIRPGRHAALPPGEAPKIASNPVSSR